jgi:hypothetical protein
MECSRLKFERFEEVGIRPDSRSDPAGTGETGKSENGKTNNPAALTAAAGAERSENRVR